MFEAASESVILVSVDDKLASKVLKYCTVVAIEKYSILPFPPLFKVSDTWAGPHWAGWISSPSKESLGGGGNGLMEMYQVLCPRRFKTYYI